jgi:hypothetical protein
MYVEISAAVLATFDAYRYHAPGRLQTAEAGSCSALKMKDYSKLTGTDYESEEPQGAQQEGK